MTLRKKAFENILGKEENAGHPKCFILSQRQIQSLEPHLISSNMIAFD